MTDPDLPLDPIERHRVVTAQLYGPVRPSVVPIVRTRLPAGLSEAELEQGYSRPSIVTLAGVAALAIARVFGLWGEVLS